MGVLSETNRAGGIPPLRFLRFSFSQAFSVPFPLFLFERESECPLFLHNGSALAATAKRLGEDWVLGLLAISQYKKKSTTGDEYLCGQSETSSALNSFSSFL